MKTIDLGTYVEQNLSWLGQSAFRIISSTGEALYIDPIGIRERAPDNTLADLILITHPHSDHYNPGAVKCLLKNETMLVAPRNMENGSLKGLTAGESIQTASFRVTGTPAYNIKKKFHPQSSGWLGYIIEVDGFKFYHAGDTDFIPEMNSLRPDVALLPIGGLFTMNVKSALAAAEALQAKLVIPMHYGFLPGTRNSNLKFAKQYSGQTKILKPLAQ